MPKLLIKFPSRERPDKFFSAIENIQSLIGLDDYIIAATLDIDDISMTNAVAMERLNSYDKLIVCPGISGSKIHAVNRNVPMDMDWDYLLVTSDDMRYIKQDFGIDMIQAFEQNPEAGLIHFPDGHVNEKLITLPLMRRDYYEQFGYIYHPSYISVFADDEQMQVAKKLGKYKYVPTNLVIHEHHIWGYGKKDALLTKTEDPAIRAIDRKNFMTRQAINFGL